MYVMTLRKRLSMESASQFLSNVLPFLLTLQDFSVHVLLVMQVWDYMLTTEHVYAHRDTISALDVCKYVEMDKPVDFLVTTATKITETVVMLIAGWRDGTDVVMDQLIHLQGAGMVGNCL